MDSESARRETWTPDQLLERLGGDEELARQLASMFVEEYPRMLDAVRVSIASGSADQVRRAAHALKGSVSNFTAGAATTTAQDLEELGREDRLAGAPAMFERLSRELEALTTHLAAFGRGDACVS